MKIQKSSEDYLETMLMLSEQRGYIKECLLPENVIMQYV